MLTDEIRSQMLAFALSEMPREACALIIVSKGRASFVPCRNVSTAPKAFEIDPNDYARAEIKGEIVHVLHSHVYQSADPSEADLVGCEATGLPWSIVSVPTGQWHSFKPKGYKAPLVGRTWGHGVLDCYSIIRDYYLENLGIKIPDFHRDFEWWSKGQNLYVENFAKAGFCEVRPEDIKTHDVVLFKILSPVVNHGGVYLGNERFLHHLDRRLSCREALGGYYRKHLVKVLRHEAL